MHKAFVVVITCIDFRFQAKIQSFLKRRGYMGRCDEIIIAGASRDFIKPLSVQDGKYVWKELAMSIKLHDPEEVIIIDHQDCGGYAQDGTIPVGLGEIKDKQLHASYLKKLAKKITKLYPTKEVKLFYAPLKARKPMAQIRQ